MSDDFEKKKQDQARKNFINEARKEQRPVDILDPKTKPKIQVPRRFKVIILNDEYSTFDTVKQILVTFFGKDEAEANRIKMDVHTNGKGIAGVYTLEVAETKAMEAQKYARDRQEPLQLVLEAEKQ